MLNFLRQIFQRTERSAAAGDRIDAATEQIASNVEELAARQRVEWGLDPVPVAIADATKPAPPRINGRFAKKSITEGET